MKAKALALIALPVFVYLAARFYVHAQVAFAVDALNVQLERAVSLNYEGVTSGLDGRIGLLGVTLQAVDGSDEIRIGELSVKLPSLRYFLELDQRVSRGEYPHELSLAVRNLSFSTQGELARRWEASMDPDAHRDALANCVTRSSLLTRMHLLDYAEIRGNFELGYRFEDRAQELIVYGAGDHAHGVEFSGELAVVLERLDSLHLMGLVSNPEIARARLAINDDGYYERVFAYCARDDQLPKEAVVALLAENLVKMFEGLPLHPDGPLLAAYKEFVSAGNRFMVTLAPQEPRKLQYLSLSDPASLPALLNVQAQVN